MSELDGTEWERKQKELFRSAMVKARAKGYGVDTARIYAENYVQGFAEGVMKTVVNTELLSIFGEDRRFIEGAVRQGESGVQNMCEWLDQVERKNHAEGLAEERLRTLQALIQAGFCLEDKAMVALGVTEEEYAAAKESLSATM